MRALRMIFLASVFFLLAGSAFGESNQGVYSQGGRTSAAPDFDFSGPMKSELLLIVVGAALLVARRRMGRSVSQTYVKADEPRQTAEVRKVASAEGVGENK
jgi:hypothetical protein